MVEILSDNGLQVYHSVYQRVEFRCKVRIKAREAVDDSLFEVGIYDDAALSSKVIDQALYKFQPTVFLGIS